MAFSRQDPAVFRLYADDELGKDGYPRAWHQFEVDDLGIGVATVRDFGIKHLVRANADHRCIRCGHPYQNGKHSNGEWSPCDDLCTHQDDGPLRVMLDDELVGEYQAYNGGLDIARAGWQEIPRAVIEAQWRILTVHHLDGDKKNCRWWNLVALDQRCHLRIQGRVILERAFILEHSDWFKEYAAGWYAFKYLGEEISREEARSRLDELLGLERVA